METLAALDEASALGTPGYIPTSLPWLQLRTVTAGKQSTRAKRSMKTFDPNLATVLWDSAVIGLARVGKDGEWLDVNPTLCSLLEYTETELYQRTFQQITHPEDVNDDIAMTRRVINGDIDFYVMSKRYITKTGKVIWIKLRVDAIRSPDGVFEYFLSQINPAHVLDDSSSRKAEPKKSTEDTVGNFIKRNWKWILTALFLVIGAAATTFHQWKTMQTQIAHLTEQLNSDGDK